MIKATIIHIFLIGFLFSSNQNLVMEKSHAEVGIDSIIEDGNNVIINIYSINKVPVAGIQFEIIPDDLFTIDSLSGGRCDDLGFNMHYNNTGRLLAFSMSGKSVPESKSESPDDNILFSVYGTKNKTFFNQVITLESTLANSMGKKNQFNSYSLYI